MAIELFKDVSSNDENEFNNLLNKVDSALTKMNKLIKELTTVRKHEHKYKDEEALLD